ncbi:methyl-accepting chemotaxis protein [Aestuariirhabdus litorea]|uniref:Methyl-accepting chemotaxis protein n=1 Tax=Aestuariirhabdus litorea TaxID=2528527 RepID=A0A3P3VNQ8_9GAMM|nr:methyl-accepting chemotaxis protein [Aestuariirhabdus litorea]RRJ83286.1 methyl-accepting chemotaxis protein [Aestuariirhabdus litorea]RWW93445.1 HAMP domain-containing protein [Endozoicomonadaceae bacterium GTF-13]
MSLKVTQRIGLGFAVLVVLLMVTGGAGLQSILTLSDSLDVTTQETTPLLISSSELAVGLLASNRAVMAYRIETNPAELPKHRSNLDRHAEHYHHQRMQINELATAAGEGELLKELDASTSEFFSRADSLLAEHAAYLDVTRARKLAEQDYLYEIDFVASELGMMVAEQRGSELGRKLQEMMSLIGAMRNYVDEVIAAQDSETAALAVDKALEMMTELEGYREWLIANEPDVFGIVEDSFAIVNKQMRGENGLLQLHLKLVSGSERTAELMQQQSAALDHSIDALNRVMEDVRAIAATAQESASATVRLDKTLILVICLASVVCAVAVAVWVGRSIHGPLNRVNRILSQIAAGDLTHKLDASGQDEFGVLATQVNQLVGRLHSLISQINASSEQVSDAAAKARKVSEDSLQAIESQREQTTQVASAVTQMGATAHEVAGSVEHSLQEVESLNEVAGESQRVILETIADIQNLQKSVLSSTDTIHRLNDFSSEIGSVLDVIRTIAEQTNLLALNAAIEAARAGEQGRGFAVVADEVRALASRTQQSTQDIQATVEKLQTQASQAASMMSSSSEQASSCVESTQHTEDALEAIVEGLSRIKDMSAQIATAAEEQSVVSQQVTQSVTSIAEMAEMASDNAQQTANESDSLQHMVEQQNTLIRQFRI